MHSLSPTEVLSTVDY